MGKVTRPILTGVFPRRRLFALLDRMRKQPAIWVCGPPGSGKTTLVSSYLETRKDPSLWYQIDQGDSDPATFFYYLGQAAKKAAPGRRKPLPPLTPEYSQGIPVFTLRYFEELYSRLIPPFDRGGNKGKQIRPLTKGGKGGFTLVFDNYQELPADSTLHELILTGLSNIPEGINVFLISRSDPSPALIRLRANHQMQILGWNHLRLTLEESEGIVRLRVRQKKPKDTISLLHKAAGGWAAGLVLMLESVERGIEPQSIGKLTPGEIVDYFGNVLFDKTDKQIQEFFLKTAFLPEMTAHMAAALTDLPQAHRLLSNLSKHNYFTEKRFSRTDPIYQYHPLFRDFLLSRAKETFPQEVLSALHRQAALLLEEDGQTEAPVLLLQGVRNWEEMIPLILKHAPLMIAQARYRPLEEWLNNLPDEIFENNPWLLYWRGVCCLPVNPSLSRPYFEKAFEKFRRQEDAAGMFLAWSGVISSITAGFENFQSLDQWICRLEDLMSACKEFPSKEIGLRVASSMFMALVLRQPQHPLIEVWAERLFPWRKAVQP